MGVYKCSIILILNLNKTNSLSNVMMILYIIQNMVIDKTTILSEIKIFTNAYSFNKNKIKYIGQ